VTLPTTYRVRTADGVHVALHHLPASVPAGRPPVILAAGTFTTRQFWLGTRTPGFATALAGAGFDCWVLEFRGHGASDHPPAWSLHSWIREDARAAVAFVLDRSASTMVAWIGHSAGGVVGAAAAAHDPALAERIVGMALVGTPAPVAMRGLRRLVARASAIATSAVPRALVPGRWLGLGPEREPGRLVHEWMRWNLEGIWRTPEGGDYLERLAGIRFPVLGIAGAGDRWLAPPEAVRDLIARFGSEDRRLVIAGRRHGYAADYGHAGLILGRAARADVWPVLLQWLRSRTDSEPPSYTTRDR
jgi:predicted alpha/beta hydrolase